MCRTEASNEDPEDVFQPDEDMLEAAPELLNMCFVLGGERKSCLGGDPEK